MRLIEARVRMFRHILDSDPVVVQPDVTCLVGKNESGKTAFLQALQRLNPARGNLKISSASQYPAWLEKNRLPAFADALPPRLMVPSNLDMRLPFASGHGRVPLCLEL